MRTFATLLLIVGSFIGIFAQQVPPSRSLLRRHYQEGEKLTYRMKGVNDDWRYEIRATGVVKRDAVGKYIEEYAWSDLISNGAPFALSPASLQFRQILSLDPDTVAPIPNLSKVDPALIGPITDMMTFYVDLWLAIRMGRLTQAGDRFYYEHGTPASWADGKRVLLGESSIDFEITLSDLNPSKKVATLMVRHVPPKRSQVTSPAAWMREAVAETPNNWVSVQKKDDKYVAAVGKETFDVRMEVSLVDGKILSGSMDNLVKARERDCSDAALTTCGDPRPRRTVRQIEITLER